MEIKTNAITISSTDKKESDKLVRLFSLDYGIIEATAKGVKKQGAKLLPVTFTFAFSEVVLAEGKGGYVVTGVSTIEPFFEISTDFDKFRTACIGLEILSDMMFGAKEYHKAFTLSLEFLKLVAFSDCDKKLVLAKYILEILKLSGYGLDVSRCFVCGKPAHELSELFVDVDMGSVCCSEHKQLRNAYYNLGKDDYKLILALNKVELFELDGRKMKDEKFDVDGVIDLMTTLVQNISGKKLQSLIKD